MRSPMRYVSQKGRNDCGVACIAMVAGISYEQAALVCERRTCDVGMNTKDVRAALIALGFVPPYRRLRRFPRWAKPMWSCALICKVPNAHGRNWHWVVMTARG